MKTPSAALSGIAIAAAVAMASLYVVLRHLGSTANPASAEVRAPREKEMVAITPIADALVQDQPAKASSREVVDVGGGVRALSEATALLESSKVFEQDDRTLDQKYAGASLGQLMAAECLLAERRDRERERIGSELVSKNRLTVAGTQVDGGPSDPSSPRPDGRPVSSISTYETVDGVVVAKSARITAEEYPEYRALELEVWWLQCKVHTLKKSQQGTTK